jgi:putative hemolysin
MPQARLSAKKPFPELSYANGSQPRLKRWFIQSVEAMSGRDRFVGLYEIWRREVAEGRDRVFNRLLDLIDVSLTCRQPWPPAMLPDTPLVIIANHPFGIGDGIAVLSLAERLGRPFKVMISADLLKIREMERYALPVDFADTREAVKNNLAVRHEALRLLKQGVTIVIFPAGGVATATKLTRPAEDLPWKIFVARLVQEARASVIPIHFSGQNGQLFHLVSRYMNLVESDKPFARFVGGVSLTLRTSLLIHEFARLSGRSIEAVVGNPLDWTALEHLRDRKLLLDRLQRAVLDLAPPAATRRRRLPRFTMPKARRIAS